MASDLISEDLQELFNHVVTKLVEQGKPSFNNDVGGCAYQGPEGRRCAAGWCMDDRTLARVHKLEENQGALDLHSLDLQITDDQRYFLQQLQDAHDNANTREDLVDRLTSVARHWRLDRAALHSKMPVSWQASGDWTQE